MDKGRVISFGWRKVTRLSSSGYPFSFWERRLPRISVRALDRVAYLYPSKRHAERGEQVGGTGFFVRVDPDDDFLYAVTNEHVVFGDAHSPAIRVKDRWRL